MKSIKIILSVALVCGLAACKQPAQQNPPEPKAPANAAVDTFAAGSTPASVQNNSLLNAPGNYLKNTAGHIGAAKAAVKVYEKSEAESMTLAGGK